MGFVRAAAQKEWRVTGEPSQDYPAGSHVGIRSLEPLPRAQMPVGETKSSAGAAFYPTEENEERELLGSSPAYSLGLDVPTRARELKGRSCVQGES